METVDIDVDLEVTDYKEYKSYPQQTYGRILGSVFFILTGVLIIRAYYGVIIEEKFFKTFDVYNVSDLFLLFGLIALSLSYFVMYYQIFLFWAGHYFVRIYKDKVTAYNMWMRPTTLLYKDIVEIRPMQFTIYGIVILTKTGKKIRLISGIERVGEAIEYIQEKSVNLKKVDFGKLRKSNRFWNFESNWGNKYEDVSVSIPRVIKYIVLIYGGFLLLLFFISKGCSR